MRTRLGGTLRRWFSAGSAWVLRHRTALPGVVNRAIDHVAEHPSSLLGRLISRGLWRYDDADVPAPTRPPRSRPAVYIAPTNYSGQGHEWGRALHAVGIDAVNVAMDVPEGYSFPADTVVPLGVYERATAWQRAERDVARGYTHVLVEAERALFGRLMRRDVAAEVRDLQAHGVSVAMMAHGTDVRLPSRHARDEPWSPFRDTTAYLGKMERDARNNRALLERLGLPTFASTPDLVDDIPFASWCPVVIAPEEWRVPRVTHVGRLRVVHASTNPALKGTVLIEPVLQRLHDQGVIDYRRIVHVPHADMPAVFAEADVVLDQFLLGSFGVAACEAMAAGCVCIAHVAPSVRSRVRAASARELPIVEATPDTLDAVLRALADDGQQREHSQETGRAYVAAVHDGALSADVLRARWIEADRAEHRGRR